ncbi:uncharacterized protein MYCFIDRAFT_41794 [Pseudocercospora fijiensis CIRAD86]|uniref:NAD-dependent epimerase/dehydratase domain-containing protein n=1 Tax=Pseudocercospora fijiensis (strain CIRAD86) TaxID=383855 RepID=M3B6K5_PSEFD|nr:uncharacterized protein MYCFIDRAFT_41794 [Pseudocercospora fijiensis CIRAD86]EME84987.1 hypothetical protein MYCFIDRAFT_41794 [Pseudocercospora fijiensis CIRAD86]
MESDETILVTGGSGFLGSYCILHALKQGYRLRTTVRNLKQSTGIRQALRNGGATTSEANSVRFFVADLNKDDGWEEACAGCDFILHVASPLTLVTPKDENEFIAPARDGTLRVLRAAKKTGTIKRVVVTSSLAAVIFGHNARAANDPFTEEDWANLKTPHHRAPAYQKSKIIAEKAAWDFIEKEGGKMELSVICPCGIFGPILNSKLAASLDLPLRLLNGTMTGIPNLGLGVVDVRDVADLHLLAMKHPKAEGERFIAQSDDRFVWIKDVAEMLRTGLSDGDCKKVASWRIPSFVVRVMGHFDDAVALVAPELGKAKPASNEKAKELLGWQPRSAKEAILSSAASLKEYGLVK